ncbi:uncharacterized protein LOC119988051 [Tripterygium wilfordii]|uniref:uncharacterized protein LOC119988051 n=1 Tax=Tripterygium wilfordii TaxID=458696 RepID=UPI0018F7F889|nr:uncharacterized protein LOC119988051 [Tripterygium wilfordii]
MWILSVDDTLSQGTRLYDQLKQPESPLCLYKSLCAGFHAYDLVVLECLAEMTDLSSMVVVEFYWLFISLRFSSTESWLKDLISRLQAIKVLFWPTYFGLFSIGKSKTLRFTVLHFFQVPTTSSDRRQWFEFKGKLGEDGDHHEFLYDCLSSSQVEEIFQDIIQISNLQLKITHSCSELQPRLVPFRNDSKAISVIRALSEAKSYASKDQVQYNRPLSYYVLRDYMQVVEREVKENYHFLGFSEPNQFQQLLTDLKLFQEDTMRLCWAGKELLRDKLLSEYSIA